MYRYLLTHPGRANKTDCSDLKTGAMFHLDSVALGNSSALSVPSPQRT